MNISRKEAEGVKRLKKRYDHLTDTDLTSIENALNDHTCQIVREFNLCYEQGVFIRTKQALVNSSIIPPALRSLRKDHKKVPIEQKTFGPPTCSVGNGNNAPNTQLCWLLATICQKAADTLCSPSECISTEDMLSSIDQENNNASKPSGQVIISLYAVARICAMLLVD